MKEEAVVRIFGWGIIRAHDMKDAKGKVIKKGHDEEAVFKCLPMIFGDCMAYMTAVKLRL